MFGVIEQLDDAAGDRGAVGLVGVLDPQQHAVADAAGDAGCGRRGDWTRIFGAVPRSLVPFGGHGDQFAVAVAAGDVGQHAAAARRPDAGLAAALRERAVVGELAQDAFQFDAVGVLQPERAGDFAGAGLAGLRADECDDLVPGGKASVAFSFHLSPCLARAFLGRCFRRRRGFCRRRLGRGATGARALLTDSAFGLAAAFFTAAFLAGFFAGSSPSAFAVTLAAFFGAAFLAARFVLPPPLAARSSISAIACASVTVSGVMSLGSVALMPPA